jgi:hypothetical protein
MEEEMEELRVEGLATHGVPESCVDDPVRAWRSVGRGTCRPGYRAAKCESGVPTLSMRWKATLLAALARAVSGPRAVKEPGHVRNLQAREPGEPVPARLADHRAGRPGNAKAVILG